MQNKAPHNTPSSMRAVPCMLPLLISTEGVDPNRERVRVASWLWSCLCGCGVCRSGLPNAGTPAPSCSKTEYAYQFILRRQTRETHKDSNDRIGGSSDRTGSAPHGVPVYAHGWINGMQRFSVQRILKGDVEIRGKSWHRIRRSIIASRTQSLGLDEWWYLRMRSARTLLRIRKANQSQLGLCHGATTRPRSPLKLKSSMILMSDKLNRLRNRAVIFPRGLNGGSRSDLQDDQYIIPLPHPSSEGIVPCFMSLV
jgi:hypothetical protein